MLQVVLYQPEIPQNTGNIIRLCTNFGAELKLIGPLGFDLDDRKLRRAGLDYIEYSRIEIFNSFDEFISTVQPRNAFAFSTRGKVLNTEVKFTRSSALIFGPETRGLPWEIIKKLGDANTLRIPMYNDSRSINLSNCVAIGLYEALRQVDFPEIS